MRELNLDTQRQNFWRDAIIKETSVRLDWLSKHEKDTYHELKTQALEANKDANENEISDKNSAASQNDSETSKPDFETRNDEEKMKQMRPVDSNTRRLLYDGFSKEGKGRYQYLQSRTINNKPEQKYDYPHISQWEYGWKQDEQVELRPPMHGRNRVVRDTFFRTRGIGYGN